jgi:Leucine rich repeat N-terminal domain
MEISSRTIKMTTKVMHHTIVLELSYMIHFLFFCTISAAMAADVDLLISFKNSLPNPNLLSNWNHKHHVCEYQGITCKGVNKTFTSAEHFLTGLADAKKHLHRCDTCQMYSYKACLRYKKIL